MYYLLELFIKTFEMTYRHENIRKGSGSAVYAYGDVGATAGWLPLGNIRLCCRTD